MVVVVLLALTASLTGCTNPPPSEPVPSPSASSAFPSDAITVLTTDKITEVDPAGVVGASSMLLTSNVYQTLMTAEPGATVLKPDAARDCIFDGPRSYTCTLSKGLTFHNGDPVTSQDVKFSIERATRLDVDGSSASLLSSLRRIETPDAATVRFRLSRVDTQFGWALASPASAIVDRKLYDPDSLQPADEALIGSGPFRVERRTGSELDLLKFDHYIGHNPAHYPAIAVKTVADSAAIEDAMSKHDADVVWRGLSAAALTRYGQQLSSGPSTTDGYGRMLLPGARVRQLIWNPASRRRGNKGLRQAISVALQDDRTLDSIVPMGVPGHRASFPTGGRATPKITWKNRITLTLGYDSTMPDGRDQAIQVRSRLEDTGGLSVRLVTDDARTDLQLVDRKAWTPTAIAWLQPYLDAPLPGSAATLDREETQFRASTDAAQGDALLGAMQSQAATDAIVLPLSQSDEAVFVKAGDTVSATSFAPGWQLGLWGLSRG